MPRPCTSDSCSSSPPGPAEQAGPARPCYSMRGRREGPRAPALSDTRARRRGPPGYQPSQAQWSAP
eukprot:4462222-Alexandrium_andersonii.AAC.1